MKCIVCGCTEDSACYDDATGRTCCWVDCEEGPLCSFCASEVIESMDAAAAPETDAPLVEVYSDYEATRYLRARGAGA